MELQFEEVKQRLNIIEGETITLKGKIDDDKARMLIINVKRIRMLLDEIEYNLM